ncbi:MAG TPA: CDP-diacylglycerol--glycerol-3-phosphate 3-phosphatidyltransferase [Actinomycetota bacterium]|nr:CDP-diacylglycerol--glycerol-3-phosphate 3-phosphatidyltransferase [Actinomycetota bacterium]
MDRKLVNPANVVTWARIAMIPVFVYLMYQAGSSRRLSLELWLAVTVYLVATFSDYLDGYLARKLDVITPMGQFLDPLADKFLVLAALVCMMLFRGFPLWATLVIVIREVAIVVLRSAAMKRGNSMPAAHHAKNKTALQLVMVLAWLFPRTGYLIPVQNALLVAGVAITVYSGVRYGMLGRKLLTPAEGYRAT